MQRGLDFHVEIPARSLPRLHIHHAELVVFELPLVVRVLYPYVHHLSFRVFVAFQDRVQKVDQKMLSFLAPEKRFENAVDGRIDFMFHGKVP